MRFRTLARIQPFFWLSPLLVLVAIAYSGTLVLAADRYSLERWSQGTFVVFFIAPLAGAMSAWEIGRLRGGGQLSYPAVRSRLAILANTLWLPLLVAVAALAISGFYVAGSLPPVARTLDLVFIVVAQMSVGAGLAFWVPRLVAAPFVLIGGYLWLVMPLAIEPLWLRNLTGLWSSCCDISDEIAPRALAATLSVHLGVIAFGLALILARKVWIGLVVGAVCLAVSGGVGVALVKDLGPDPVRARTSPLVCSTDQVTICVWPEHETSLGTIAGTTRTAVASWRASGIPAPATWTEAKSGSGGTYFQAPSATDEDAIRAAIAYALVPPVPACADDQAYPAGQLREYVFYWLAEVAGGTNARNWGVGAKVKSFVEDLRTQPVQEQLEWYSAASESLTGCSPVDMPGLEP